MASDLNYNSVVLLLHCNGSNGGTTFTDNSSIAATVTPTSCTTSTAQTKYGSASALFNGTSSFLSIPFNSNYRLLGNDWTIEFWIRPTNAAPSAQEYIISHREDGVGSNQPLLILRRDATTGVITFVHSDASGASITVVSSSASPSTGVWTHVALTRASGTVKVWMGGADVTVSTTNLTTAYPAIDSGHHLFIGSFQPSNTLFYNGYLDDIRITNGVARYTSTFTPQTYEFGDYAEPSNTVSESVGTVTTSLTTQSANELVSTLFSLIGLAENQYKDELISEILLLVLTSDDKQVVYNSINSEVLSLISTGIIFFTATISELLSIIASPSIGSISVDISELLINLDSNINSINTRNEIIDTLVVLDVVLLKFKGIVLDGLSISSSGSMILNNIETILSSLTLEDTTSARVSLSNLILDIITIVSEASYDFRYTISDGLTVTDNISLLWSLFNSIIDNLTISSSYNVSALYLLSLSESVALASATSNSALVKEILSGNIVIRVPTASGQDSYLAYTFSPETSSVTTYDNYNFKTATKFNGKYLFGNDTGLYEYGGTTDAGDPVRAYIETAAFSFGTSNLKQIPAIYLGVATDDTMLLIVRFDGRGELTYKLNKRTDNLQTRKVDIGKGLIGRYFQFELITDADQFNMESIDLYPVALKRKL
jgi:hypothetical protein